MSFREVSTSVKCFAMLGCGLWFHGNIVSAGASRANGANSLVFSLTVSFLLGWMAEGCVFRLFSLGCPFPPLQRWNLLSR